jgi:hypothetical protein
MPHWMVSWVPCFAKKWFLDVAQKNTLFSAWQGTVEMWRLVASLANEHTLVPPDNVSTTKAPPHVTPKLNMMKPKLRRVSVRCSVRLHPQISAVGAKGELAEATSRKWQKMWSLTIWWLEYSPQPYRKKSILLRFCYILYVHLWKDLTRVVLFDFEESA